MTPDRVTITHPDLPDASPTVTRQAFELSWHHSGWALSPGQDAQPTGTADQAVTDVPDGTVGQVADWAGTDPHRISAAVAAEQDRPEPRKGVLALADKV